MIDRKAPTADAVSGCAAAGLAERDVRLTIV